MLHEATAARLLQIAQWMGPHVLKLAQLPQPIAPPALGTEAADVRLAAQRMGQVLDGLWTHLALTMLEGERAAGVPGMSMGERYAAHRLALRAMKMDTVLRGSGAANLEAWCRRQVGFYEGRMVHAAHYFSREAAEASRLDQSYALRGQLMQIVEAQQSLVRAATNLFAYARILPRTP